MSGFPRTSLTVLLLTCACGSAPPSPSTPTPQLAVASAPAEKSLPAAATPTRDAAAETDAAPSARAMMRVPAGEFSMGDKQVRDRSPVHVVRVSAYELDRTEVTTAEYAACVAAGACETTFRSRTCNLGHADRDRHPVNCVTAAHAEAYCQWVGKRLPSEEEWEYAARGRDARSYPWGSSTPDAQVCWRRWTSRAGTCVVGSLTEGANDLGLLDLAGNVAEWTSSGFSDDYTKPRSDKLRVCRGGSWGDTDPAVLSSTCRCRYDPTQSSDQIGFRCAR